MASYRGHLMLSAPLGAGYGALSLLNHDLDWGACLLGGGLTALGGLLPDLDSDSGVPVRELFGFTAAAAAFVAYHPLREHNWSLEQALVLMAGVYVLVRYVFANQFRRFTVHRGMFHSIPAMLIAGLAVYLVYPSQDFLLRAYLAGGVMVGFLSHLVLDELCAVDFMGVRIRLNKFAGSALKFFSPSVPATVATYVVLLALGWFAWDGLPSWARSPTSWPRPAWLGGGTQHTANIP